MPVCVFNGCTTGSKRKGIVKDPSVHVNSFPKDEHLRAIWLKQIHWGNNTFKNINVNTDVVCSLHFSKSNFVEKSLKQKLFDHSPKRRRLKPDAIPMSAYGFEYDDVPFCRSPIDDSIIKTPSGLFTVTNNRPEVLCTTSYSNEFKSPIGLFSVTCENGINDDKQHPQSCRVKLFSSANTITGVDALPLDNYNHDDEIKKLKNIISIQQKEILTLKENLNRVSLNFETWFTERLSHLFSPTQIELLLRPKHKVFRWTPEDISSAISLRSISTKAYRYLRDKNKFPLPGLSTLRQWVSNFQVEPGLLTNVLTLMKAKSVLLTSEQKITVISFDETYVSNRICYDKKTEKVYGPHKCVQTVVARGLIGNWKQPIYYNYDTPMDKNLLLKIIEELYTIGFNVVSIVSDMGPTNMGLWRSLNISVENTLLKHPISNNNVHVFADVPHLIKLARNHFLDKGFILPDGKYIGKNILQKLLNLNSGKDFKLAHKLTERHINVEGAERMNVRLAVNVFSNTVSKALSFCGQNHVIDKYNWKNASEVIGLFNDWFDLLNTQHKIDKGTESYGLNLKIQIDLLSKMTHFILHMRVHGKNHLLPFQKGIAISNNSLINLFNDLKRQGTSFILTRKLNQDVVENLFSFLKGMAGSACNNITVLDFKYCLRWYILGKNSNFVFTKNNNTENDLEESLLNNSECLTSEVIQDSELLPESLSLDTYNNELAEIESAYGTAMAIIPSDYSSILEEFETENAIEPFDDLEIECVQYITGYLINRFANKYPCLLDSEVSDKNETSKSNWINHISKGNLKNHSENLLKLAKIMEPYFKELHGDGLSKASAIMKTLTNKLLDISTKLGIPHEVLRCLVRTRTFIRLNNLNKDLLNKTQKHHSKSKLKKFTN